MITWDKFFVNMIKIGIILLILVGVLMHFCGEPFFPSEIYGVEIGKTVQLRAPLDKLAPELDLQIQKIISTLQGKMQMGDIRAESINFKTVNDLTGIRWDDTNNHLEFMIEGVQVAHIAADGSYTDDVP